MLIELNETIEDSDNNNDNAEGIISDAVMLPDEIDNKVYWINHIDLNSWKWMELMTTTLKFH